MLLSMTGFGNASQTSDAASVSVELKAVNNRYLKVSVRLPDIAARFESDIEKLIRERIARGSLQLSFRVKAAATENGYSLDEGVLSQYVSQLNQVQTNLPGVDATLPSLTDLLQLPGVIAERELPDNAEESIWPLMKSSLLEALDQFQTFRQTEGESMRLDLAAQCGVISTQLEQIETRAPDVVSDYREKILERVRRTVQDADVPVEDKDVIREVALFADRCDINEEITRLRSHLAQFDEFLNGDRSLGRKLEFVSQEMFREINTIGSKANNVGIAHCVVEMKAAIERIREVLQNVE
ncbi:MAG: YicC family protein [Planctomycetaceae bacterium]|nr:YicC family protein [Planctomycetaceae bacterium]